MTRRRSSGHSWSVGEPPATEGWGDAAEARERARSAVSDAFSRGTGELPRRRCPNCGHEAATLSARCPSCEKRYDRRLPWLKDWMRVSLAGAGLLALGITVALVSPDVQDTKRERAARLYAERSKRVTAERARLAREQAPVRGVVPGVRPVDDRLPDAERRARRRAAVVAVEEAIALDARKRIAAKRLDGPVKFAECGPLVRTPDSLADDAILTKRLGRYDCVAVKTDVRRFGRTVALFGHPYVATIDFDRMTYVICKDNKVPGERGAALAKVTLVPECLGLDEDAERFANGYIQPEE